MTGKVLDGEFIVKVAGVVQGVKPGTRFGSSTVLERLPATVNSKGDVKALWRLQCEICRRKVVVNLSNGRSPECRCAERATDQRHTNQVLRILVTTETPFLTLREIRSQLADFGTRVGIRNEASLRTILSELMDNGRVKQARDARARGYCAIRSSEQPVRAQEDTAIKVIDGCTYE
jgi:predicted transcriptional regulator